MARYHKLALALLACAATPAMAREARKSEPHKQILVATSTAGDAVRTLARQAGVNIGFSDPALATIRVRGVKGRLTDAQALSRLLSGSGLLARMLGPGAWMIERQAPRPARPGPDLAEVPVTFGNGNGILVTGAKRRVPLASYPGDVEIIRGDTLSADAAKQGGDQIETRAASVTSTHLGPGRNKLFIRGIADSSIVGPTQATVGQYWNNSRITYSAPDPSLRLYDVDRIEVLEGPQGTLYGAGSLGGVVRVVPTAPDLANPGARAWAGVTGIQQGQTGADGGAVINLPLVDDRLGLRVLGFGGLDGGYIHDRLRNLDDINSVRSWGARSRLRFAPTSDLTIDLSVLTQRIAGADSQYTDGNGDGLARASAIAQPYSNAIGFGDLVVTRRWDDLELTASFTHAGQHVYEIYQGSALSDPLFPGNAPMAGAFVTAYTQDNRIRMSGSELRLSRSRNDGTGWLIALSVLHNVDRILRTTGGTDTTAVVLAGVAANTTLGAVSTVPGGTPTIFGLAGGAVPLALLTGVHNLVDEVTLYGEYTLALNTRITATFGGRLTRSRLSGSYDDALAAQALRIDPTSTAVRHETRAMPSLALAYRPADTVTLFARFEESYRPGGIAVQQDYIQRFTSDEVLSAEAGARIGNSALDAGVTLSWTDWRNIQADLIDGYGFPTTANIGSGHVLSNGWTLHWRPARGLQLEAAVYLNSSHITETSIASASLVAPATLSGRLPNVADGSGRAAIAYTVPVGDHDRLDLSGFVRYLGKSTLGVGSILGREQGDYWDSGLNLRLGDTHRSFSFSLTNVFNARGNRFAFGSPFLLRGGNQMTPMQPRSLRAGLDFSF